MDERRCVVEREPAAKAAVQDVVQMVGEARELGARERDLVGRDVDSWQLGRDDKRTSDRKSPRKANAAVDVVERGKEARTLGRRPRGSSRRPRPSAARPRSPGRTREPIQPGSGSRHRRRGPVGRRRASGEGRPRRPAPVGWRPARVDGFECPAGANAPRARDQGPDRARDLGERRVPVSQLGRVSTAVDLAERADDHGRDLDDRCRRQPLANEVARLFIRAGAFPAETIKTLLLGGRELPVGRRIVAAGSLGTEPVGSIALAPVSELDVRKATGGIRRDYKDQERLYGHVAEADGQPGPELVPCRLVAPGRT